MTRTLTLSARVRPWLVLAAFALIAKSCPTPAYADAKIYRKLLPSTAWVLTEDGLGSGVLIDVERRLLVTNEHVVDNANSVLVFFPDFEEGRHIAEPQHYQDNASRLAIKGRVLITDAKRDLALVQLERLPTRVAAVKLAKESPSPGETVHSIGNPGASGPLWAYTSGSVRAVYRKRFNSGKPREMLVVMTQSPINPGDSGGPVVNSEGELVALSESFDQKARLVSNCVDVSEIRALLAEEKAVQELVTNARLKIVRETPRSYAVQSSASGDTRTVYIAKATERSGNVQMRRVFSVAITVDGPLPSEAAEKLSQENARTKEGLWAVESTTSGKTMVLFSVTSNTTSPDKLAAAVEYVAKMAGTFKKPSE